MTAGIVRELVTRLSFVVNTKALNGFNRSISSIKKGMVSFQNGFRNFALTARNFALSVGGLFSSISLVANKLFDSERKLTTLSKVTGINRDQIDRLRIAMNGMGVSTQTFQSILSHLSSGLNQAKLGYGDLSKFSAATGISLRNTNGKFKRTDVLLGEFVDHAREIENPELQGLFLKMAFGNLSPEEATSLLSKSSKDLQAAATSAGSLQATVSDTDRAELDKFKKNFSDLQELIIKWGTEITLGVLPYLNSALEGFVNIGSSIKDLRTYFSELATSLSSLFEPIVETAKTFKNFIAPSGSQTDSYFQKAKNFAYEVGYDYLHLPETIDRASRSLFNVPLLNDSGTTNQINVNMTVPAGTSQEQANFIENAATQSFDKAGDNLGREQRQMRNQNTLMAY